MYFINIIYNNEYILLYYYKTVVYSTKKMYAFMTEFKDQLVMTIV